MNLAGISQPDSLSIASLITNIIFGIIATITSVVAISLSRKRKLLIYTILSDTQVISIHKEMEKKIQIHYGVFKVARLRLIEILIKNSGTEVINQKDFDTPITFCKAFNFQDGKPITFWDKISITPENTNAEFGIFGHKLGLRPLMINPKENIKLKFLIGETDINTEIKVEGRIAGTRLIEVKQVGNSPRKARLVLYFKGIVIMCSLGVAGYAVLFLNNLQLMTFSTIIAILLATAFIIEYFNLIFVEYPNEKQAV